MKKDLVPAEEYRRLKLVKEKFGNDGYYHYACPTCGAIGLRDYQSFCSECGQKLRWGYPKMKRVPDDNICILVNQNTDEVVFSGDFEHCELMLYARRYLLSDESYIIKELKQSNIHYNKIKINNN